MVKPRQYDARYKFECVVETLKRDNVVEIARRRDIRPNLLSKWRSQFMDNGPKLFETVPDKEISNLKNQINKLEQLLGKKEVELSFMQNFLGSLDSRHGK